MKDRVRGVRVSRCKDLPEQFLIGATSAVAIVTLVATCLGFYLGEL